MGFTAVCSTELNPLFNLLFTIQWIKDPVPEKDSKSSNIYNNSQLHCYSVGDSHTHEDNKRAFVLLAN